MFSRDGGHGSVSELPEGRPREGQVSLVVLYFNLLTFLPVNCPQVVPCNQCCGSITFLCGSGSADPAFFIIDLQDASKKLIFLHKFSAYYFLKVHLYHFSKGSKKSQNSRIKVFLTIFD
jgi:hypothetical protein